MVTHLLNIVALLLIFQVANSAQQTNVFIVQTTGELPPYSHNTNGIITGTSLSLLQEIADIQNFSVNISSAESAIIFQNLNRGKIDIGLPIVRDSSFSSEIWFSTPVAYVSYDIFSTVNNSLYNITELSGATVYVVKNDPIFHELKKDFPTTTFLYADNISKILLLLEQGKAKYAVLPKQSAVYIAEENKFSNIIYNRLLSYSLPLCIAVNSDNLHLLTMINEGLSILKLSGKYDKILGDYNSDGNAGSVWYNSRYFVMIMIVLFNVLIIGIIWLINFKNKISRSRETLFHVLNNIPHQISLKDHEGKYVFVNRAFADNYNQPPDYFEGKTQKDVHLSEIEIQKFAEVEQKLYSDDNSLNLLINEEALTFPGGVRKTIQFTRLLIDTDYSPTKSLLTLGIDITDRVHNLELLERSENKFKLLFENAGLSIIIHGFDGNIVDANEHACNSLGYTRDEMLNMKAWDIEKSYSPFSGTQLIESIGENNTYQTEGYHVKKDGSGFRVLVRLAIVKLNDKKLVLAICSNIEEQKRKEDRIRMQTTALNAAANGIAIVDVEGHFVWVNKSFSSLTGYAKEEILGAHTRILKSGFQDVSFYKNLWDTVLNGKQWHGIFVNKRKNGSYYSEEASITPVFDDRGRISHFVSVKTDITKRLEIEQQIRDSEQRYKYLFAKAPVGIFQFNKELILETFNDHFINIFRSSREKLQDLDLNNLVDQSFVPNLRSTLQGVDTNYSGPYHTTTSDADIFITLHTRAFYNDQNEIIGGIGIVEDVTKVKEIETELMRSERKYRSIFENLMDVYYMTDIDGTILNISPSVKRLFKISDHKYLLNGKNVAEFYNNPENREPLIKQLNSTGFINNYYLDLKRPDGTLVHVELNTHYVYDNEGKPIAVEGMIRDITDRKIAEDELRIGEQKLRNIIENSSDGIVLVNNKGKIVEWNTAAEKITGYTKEDVFEKYIWDVQYKFAPDIVREESYRELLKTSVIASIEAGKIVKGGEIQEAKIKRKDNTEIFTQSSVAIISTPQGSMIVSILRDVSVLKEAENQLKLAKERAEQSNKLKSEFLAQMSHEIRTPVNAILSFAGLMEEELKDKLETDLQDGFRAMRTAGNRIIRTIDLILNMSEIQTGTYDYNITEIDLYIDILVNLSAEHKSMLKNKNLSLEIHKPDFPAVIHGDEYTVNQIFNNLIDNAIKYTPEGNIQIRFAAETDAIVVYIKDTGIGISKEYLPHLFEAFTQEEQGYTRKFEGNGLGLALVKKYCTLNNADIKVSSIKGEGTEFAVIFRTV